MAIRAEVRASGGGRVKIALMRIEIDMVEQFPAVSVHFEGEDLFGINQGWLIADLSEEEAADLRRVRDGWHSWETRLLEMLASGSPPAGFFS
jgi:hypothetical protein